MFLKKLQFLLCVLLWAFPISRGTTQTPERQDTPTAKTGPDTHRIDLPTVLRLAHARNLDVKIAREKLKEAKANQDSAAWGFFPSLSPGASFRRHEGRIQAVDGAMFDVDKQSYNVGGTITAQVDLGEVLYKELAAKQLSTAASQELETQRQDSLAVAAQAYFELARAKGLVVVLNEGVEISKNYQNQIHEGVAAGIAFKGDELRVQTQTERLQISLRQAVEQQRVFSSRLARTLHLDPSMEFSPDETELVMVTVINPDSPLDGLVQQALRTRPELRQSEAAISAARDSKNGAVYGPLIPTVGAQIFGGGLGGGRGSSTGNFASSEDYYVGVGWRVGPGGLFDFGRINASKARWEVSRLTAEKLKDQIIGEVVESHTRLRSLCDQIQATKQNLATTAEALRLTRQRKEFGVGVVLEDIQAQQDATRARADHLTTIADFNKAEYSLLRAIGSLSQPKGANE